MLMDSNITTEAATSPPTSTGKSHQNVEEMRKYFIAVGVLAGICVILGLVNLYLQWTEKKHKSPWGWKSSGGGREEGGGGRQVKANFLFAQRPSTSSVKA